MCCCQGSGCTRVYLRSFQIFVEFFVRRWNQWCRTLLLHHSHFSEIQMKNGRNTNEKWKKYKWKMDEIQIKQGRNMVEWFAEIYSVTVFCATVKPMMLDTLPALQPLPFFYLLFLFLFHRLNHIEQVRKCSATHIGLTWGLQWVGLQCLRSSLS